MVTLAIGIVFIKLPFVYVPKTVSEDYQVPKSKVILGGWTGFAAYASFKDATKGTDLDAGDSLNIQVNATQSKHIDFSVSAVNSNEEVTATYLFYPDVSTLTVDWVVPLTSEYHFTFNSINLFTYKDATLLVTKQWTETAYRDVTKTYRLLPFEVVYLGAVLAFLGIGLTTFGVAKKEEPKSLARAKNRLLETLWRKHWLPFLQLSPEARNPWRSRDDDKTRVVLCSFSPRSF